MCLLVEGIVFLYVFFRFNASFRVPSAVPFPYTPATLSATVDIYNVTSQSWTSSSTGAGSLSAPRYLMAAAAAGTKVVFAGGVYDINVES